MNRFCLIVVVLVIFLSACENETHEDYSMTEIELLAGNEMVIENKEQAILKWKDTVDGGDNPMIAGCHIEHTAQDCSDTGVYFGSDSCTNARKILEYTNADCHDRDPVDLKPYDCNKLCIEKGHWFGVCKVVPNACDGHPSAKCQCFDRPPEL